MSNSEFWEDRWTSEQTGWDIGSAAPALVEYFKTIKNRDAFILIPGCGNAYEAEWLVENGYSNVYLIDIAPSAIEKVRKRIPALPGNQLICGDFFSVEIPKFDYIIEQTFFCAIDPSFRLQYSRRMFETLKTDGVLAGLLFNCTFEGGPPFGGSEEEYRALFEPLFSIKNMKVTNLSIPPRAGRELFIELTPR